MQTEKEKNGVGLETRLVNTCTPQGLVKKYISRMRVKGDYSDHGDRRVRTRLINWIKFRE